MSLAALPGCWYGMMAVHETGHVVGALATCGRIERVVLPLLSFSRTDVAPNPHPLLVAWAGPLIGALVPGGAWIAVRRPPSLRLLLGLWAGFCLVSNGAYIGAGAAGRVGDAGDLLAHGAPAWTLYAFGIVAGAFGLWVWHRAFEHARRSPPPIAPSMCGAALFSAFWLLVVVVI